MWMILWGTFLAVSVSVTLAGEKNQKGINVPVFTALDLKTGWRKVEFAQILHTTGLLAIRSVDSTARERALKGMCSCIYNLRLVPDVSTATITLDDGTIRSTFATATVGSTPLPLPENLTTMCGSDMDHLRDEVAHAADAFISALDQSLVEVGQHRSGGTSSLLRNAYGGKYYSISEIRESANHLEHFHVYSKENRATSNNSVRTAMAIGPHESSYNDAAALDWHTDAGLFLAFVPALDCHDPYKQDESFLMGGGIPAVFPSDSVVIMLGEGARSWLTSPLPLHATRHAVKMQEGERRAWYGMMFLVPESAIVQTEPTPRTFRDMKEAMVIPTNRKPSTSTEGLAVDNDDDDIQTHISMFIGCGVADNDEHIQPVDFHSSTSPARKRSRLQHVKDASVCNNSTNFFCWMVCRSIPDYDRARDYISKGDSLYCLDPSVLANTNQNLSLAVEACEGTHNARCVGSWHPTAPGIPANEIIFNKTDAIKTATPFCYGGTSMYMDGFHWRDTACVIYLFPQWILSSKRKVAGASIGTVLFGITLEVVMVERRRVMASASSGYQRLTMSACFYGLQLTMGYLLMLVVMTYSGPLFMCVILGLVGGHVLFSAQDALFRRSLNETKDTKENSNETQMESGRSTPSMKESGIPEGCTPCCQNML